ncbi:hypothetical protein M422DRAFT_30600 [Sphaerobolus stellatus SS14]|uniref:Protein kinase domain-containing protein n=1 Tax=Sphaerobolus stellatus (strain SS14) TaxID=990650 RepID=A0A0C9ULX4_SPHS4|nr:hypothetical protein M422DRAFT_30600 [Sphaerobolus stellatus SS14]
MHRFRWAPSHQPSASPTSSVDEEDCNSRVTPDWSHYRPLLLKHGYHLDTVGDVRAYYEHYWANQCHEGSSNSRSGLLSCKGYPCPDRLDDELCKDRGLPDSLFRGTQRPSGKKVIIKTVDSRSRELEVLLYLSTPACRRDAANHTIPALDFIIVREDHLAFIVLEEWSASLTHCTPSTSRAFLGAIRQCIEGLHFMHIHNIAHLDISFSNILTNHSGSYAYIDFELSRRFLPGETPLVKGIRGTELPPEIERGEASSAFKVDIWALGVTILRAYKASEVEVPHFKEFVRPLLHENPKMRPSAAAVLHAMERIYPEARPHKWNIGAPIN